MERGIKISRGGVRKYDINGAATANADTRCLQVWDVHPLDDRKLLVFIGRASMNNRSAERGLNLGG